MPKRKIPDRWIPYNACGDVIDGTRIICFKVPLYRSVQERVPGLTKIWDIEAVLAEIPKLGAVIDLTNTDRYYNPREFEIKNVVHRKMLIPGREIPPESKVKEFMDAVDEFLGKNSELLVGVHCTHGLNRTGYMVCRYMRDRLNIPAQEAINRFEKARGYKIERKNYLASLLNKKIPPPEFGKGTIIKPINSQHDLSNVESPEYGYDSRYSNNRYGQNSGRYRRNDGFRNDQYGRNYNSNDGSDRYEHSTNGYHHPWGNRSEGSSYDQYSTNYSSNDRNNSYQHSSNRYLSWRNSGSYGQGSTNYNSNSRNDRYQQRNNGHLPWGNMSERSSYNGQTSTDFHSNNGGYSSWNNGDRSTSGRSGNYFSHD